MKIILLVSTYLPLPLLPTPPRSRYASAAAALRFVLAAYANGQNCVHLSLGSDRNQHRERQTHTHTGRQVDREKGREGSVPG